MVNKRGEQQGEQAGERIGEQQVNSEEIIINFHTVTKIQGEQSSEPAVLFTIPPVRGVNR